MVYLNEFENAIKEKKSETLIKLWEEYCYDADFNLRELRKILEIIYNSEMRKYLGKCIGDILPALESSEDGDDKDFHKSFALIYDIQTSNNSELAEIATRYLKKYHPENNIFLKLVGLRGENSFQGAISNYMLLEHLQVGNFVYHKAGWGTSEIMEVSLVREDIIVESEFMDGLQRISFKNSFLNLDILDKDNFLAKRFGFPDDLEKEAMDDPAGVIKQLLRDLGPRNASEIKDEMLDLVILKENWPKWWQVARVKLKKDSSVHVPSNCKDNFFLLDPSTTHFTRIKESIESSESISEKIAAIYSAIKNFPDEVKEESCEDYLLKLLDGLVSKANSVENAQILMLLDILHKKVDFSALVKQDNIEEIIYGIHIKALRKRLIAEVKEYRDDWAEMFIKFLLNIELNLVRDYIISTLISSGLSHMIEDVIESVLKDPFKESGFFIWYFGKIMGMDNSLPCCSKGYRIKYLEVFLEYLAALQYEDPSLTKKLISKLVKDRYSIVRSIFKDTTLEETKEILLLFTKCYYFSEYDIKTLRSLAAVYHHELSLKDVSSRNDMWITEGSLNEAKKRVAHILNFELTRNADEIARARAEGDLRENAGYKAALGKRECLHSELKLLSSYIDGARILTPDDVDVSKVGIGTVVQVKNCSGVKEFTILGPLDANVGEGIISVGSKVAQDMYDKCIGDDFIFGEKPFTIIAIGSYYDK